MNTENIVKQFRIRLALMLGSELVVLHWFGSTAKGKRGRCSDIDLLVETNAPLPSAKRDQVADIAVDFCADFGVLLDVHYYTTWELTHPPYATSPFIESVLTEGVRK